MKFSYWSMCNANARYITSLTNEALLNKDTFHCSKSTVKNYSLFSLVIEQEQEWKSSVREGSLQASSLLSVTRKTLYKVLCVFLLLKFPASSFPFIHPSQGTFSWLSGLLYGLIKVMKQTFAIHSIMIV